MLGKNLSVLFYLKKQKNYGSGPMPIYLRVSMEGDVKELCTSRKCDPKVWDKRAERAIGKTGDVKE